MIETLKSGLTEVVTTIDSKFQGSLSFLSDIKEAGWEKVTGLVNDIIGIEPLIEATGFCMKEFSIDAGIPPSIVHVFLKEKDVDPQTVERILEENKEKELLVLIVRALQKADSLQQRMKLSDYKFYALTMKLGIPPAISLKFAKQ